MEKYLIFIQFRNYWNFSLINMFSVLIGCVFTLKCKEY